MINYGKISINLNKPIGNKSIMSIGFNGKWKLKIEKLMKLKEKKKDSCMKKNKNNSKKNKNYKNILAKFNFVIYWFSTLITLKKIGIDPMMPIKML